MSFCYKSARIWKLAGYFIIAIKIVLPLIIIILGIVDFAKAVVSSDQKVIKDAGGSLLRRLIAAVIIFFIPTIIHFIFEVVAGYSEDVKNDFENCFNCLVYPNNKCDTTYDPNDGFFPTD